MTKRKRIFSGSPLEPKISFSRAVRSGNFISISGTAPLNADGSTAFVSDVYKQTKCCLEIITQAVEKAGGKLSHIIRTRIMLKDIKKWKEAAKAHGEIFSDIQPACTFVEVRGFIRPEWLVEIEADAVIDD